MNDPFAALAERYLASGDTLRQIVRHALVARALEVYLPDPPSLMLDVGGGAGQQAIPLAERGYEVTILDPSPRMLDEAQSLLNEEEAQTRKRVRLVDGVGEDAPRIFGSGSFDAVLCHGVLMYLDEPRTMIRAISTVVRPGGAVSILAKNAAALAMRPALEGRYADASAALDADRDLGYLGVVTRGDTIEALTAAFSETGMAREAWYGVRVFTDHLGDAMPNHNLLEVLDLEWEAGMREPYRSAARLIHILGKKTDGDSVRR